jgi:RNA polymerase sigma-70 factor (ECF subfamily)
MRGELCEEAIRLGRMLAELLPDSSEVLGLLALMLYQHARRAARLDETLELVALHEQDPALWDQAGIAEATQVIERSFRICVGGFYQTQAHIAALHVRESDSIKWEKIAFLYRYLCEIRPSPLFELNRIAAVAKLGKLSEADAALGEPGLQAALRDYPYYYALRASVRESLGQVAAAMQDYGLAASQTKNATEQRRLEQAIHRLAQGGASA